MKNNNTWEELQVELSKEILVSLKRNGFKYTMPVQEASIPLMLKHYDLAVEAQTGSGKTLSFVVPLLQKYLSFPLPTNHKAAVRFAILSPTRELCQQTLSVITKLLHQIPDQVKANAYMQGIKCVTGGNDVKDDIQNVKESCLVLIGTVGRLRQLCNHFESNWLKKVQYLYIDEADRVLKEKGIKQLIKAFQKVRRTAMFSATLQGLQPEDYEFYGMRNLAKISLKSINKQPKANKAERTAYVIPKNLNNTYIIMNNRLSKINFLISFMIQYSQAKIIIFFNTCASVDFYTKVLRDFLTREDDEIYVEGIHGKLKNKKRNRILQIFTERKNGCLFATDVVSRGIDFDHVDFIVQVDPPEDPDNYIHRIGRTARVNNSGTAILLIQKHEESFITYLENKEVGVKEEVLNTYTPNPGSYEEQIMKLMIQDRDYVQKSKRAFVSYIRSYKEHDLKYIFEFKHLDLGWTAQSFFLLRIPRIKEILGKKVQHFTQSEIDLENIPWKNSNQQSQFQVKKEKLQKIQDEKQKQRLKEKVDIKNMKSKRKRLKAKRQSQMMKSMNSDYRQLMKEKKKKHEQLQDEESDYNSEDTEQIEKRMMQKYGK